jgi:hypothetical protein
MMVTERVLDKISEAKCGEEIIIASWHEEGGGPR